MGTTITYSRTETMCALPDASADIVSSMTIDEVIDAMIWCRGYTSKAAFFAEVERRAAEGTVKGA